MRDYILAIDQGTTSSRAIVFAKDRSIAGSGQKEFTQIFPQDGWVEHDPEEIWESVVWSVKTALEDAKITANDVAAIGITNQRETTLIWDRKTGKAVHNAIVWQDRRTAAYCATLKKDGHEALVTDKTGLLLDPYFSGTKIKWLLDNVEGVRARAEAGDLAFGTIDSFLIWRLTGGKSHVTDATNAGRTLLFDIADNEWDSDLLNLFTVPAALLPTVKDCADDFGTAEASLFGADIPILGVAGDQHAATIGQACFEPGMLKSTYGTGCFALLNTGTDIVRSKNRLLTTIAYRLNGETVYALEGSIFIAGAAVQWIRDGLKLVKHASETGPLARTADPSQNVYMVPAFVGLGAPWWDADARGAIYGLTRNSGPAEIAKAALEAVCYQTRDLLEAMRKDWGDSGKTVLRVDGGMVASDWTMQFLADILDAPVDRPRILETTALGAAWLAGSKAGVWPDMAEFAASWALDKQFKPEMDATTRDAKIKGWDDAVQRTLTTR
ncbi:glycerol kinase GlpK [Devosia neptuniae]|jgi:glycerol kinase|uniref:glycerol kinase GlpK n=1 Tax=Devosia TaxID=46913 RepID=UPI0022B01119|nr:glycerol kinase GlpK [Devosia neptuniae]MCZ4344521.1 glycerol kinase GlpK [Devosia neptuniae]|tara:strand:+ start:17249 stop:18739 length:1491 start_codon:yes stop_codon:yes gene_type:complete